MKCDGFARVIIPFPPGNTLDIMTRLIGPRLTERLGQNVIVDNRAGASGMLGLELAANAAPAGTPREIVMLLDQEINRAMALPEVKEKLHAAGLIVVVEPPEFFAQTIKSDYEKYGKLIRDIGLQPR